MGGILEHWHVPIPINGQLVTYNYLATYETALQFSPQIVMRGYWDSFVMLAGTWGALVDVDFVS